MSKSPHSRIQVDIFGMRPALLARARANRTYISAVVRRALARELGLEGTPEAVGFTDPMKPPNAGALNAVLVQLTSVEVARLTEGARAAALSRGAYLAALMEKGPEPISGAERRALTAALITSSSELSTFSRNTLQLTYLLREGNVQQALEHREMLDHLVADVHRHLKLAAQVLSDLQGFHRIFHDLPARPSKTSSGRST